MSFRGPYRLMSLTVLLCGLPAFCQSASTASPTTPPCAIAPPPVKGERFPVYLTDSEAKLKAEASALRGIKFTKENTQADAVLKPAGEAIEAMLAHIPRLVANEELAQAFVNLPYMVNETTQGSSQPTASGRRGMGGVDSGSQALEGEDLQKALHAMLDAQKRRSNFSYRIQSNPDAGNGNLLEEFRTDTNNDPVSVSDKRPGSPRGIGFAVSWLRFVPANQSESQFRLLGFQKVDGHETVALAFAQLPDRVRVPAEIAVRETSCAFFTQGIVWIDRTSFAIVRLQTDLIAPLAALHMTQMRSTIDFAEVKIPERNLSLWMPAAVEIVWMTDSQAGGELHRYSHYRLFTSTSRIVTNPVQ